MQKVFISDLKDRMDENDGKIPFSFIQDEVKRGQVQYMQLTPNMRVCVITLRTGHEVIGVAQVLDAKNDVESIGNEVAYANAVNELWKVFGSIAKVL